MPASRCWRAALLTQSGHRWAWKDPSYHVYRTVPVPALGGGVGGELSVEFAEQHDAAGEAKLGAGRGEGGILRRRGAVDDKARAGKRLEHGGECRIADPVVRPGDARAQRERGLGIEQQQAVETSAQFAARVGRVA